MNISVRDVEPQNAVVHEDGETSERVIAMTFGSLFTGGGGGDIGLDRAGMKCVWQCEIDRQCRSVLARHWPNVTKYDDITTMNKPAKVDVIIGGSPCQGFSVAGERGGLDDDRSNLFREMVRIVDEVKPKYVIWENVPGIVSGFDEVLADEHYELFSWAKRRELAIEAGGLVRRWWLGAVLRSFADIGYGGAYRIIDSRYFGVPQRRRRVFAVFARGTRRDPGTDRCRQILSFAEGMPRNSAKGKEAKKDVAGTLGGGSGKRGYCSDTERMTFVPAVSAKWSKGSGGPSGDECQNLVTHTLRGEGFDASEDGTGRGTPLVSCFDARQNNVSLYGNQTSPLDTSGYTHAVAFQCQGSNVGEMGTIRAGNGNVTGGVPFMAFTSKDHGADAGELSPTLRSMGHSKSHANGGGQVAVTQRQGVRRLTPRETERLQGWPDDHTRWDDHGKEIADGPRYRMTGNGMTANVVEWIGRRILEFSTCQ